MGKNKRTRQALLKEIARLKKLSLCDDLTGLFCRRKLEVDIKRYYDLYLRHDIKFDIVMLDIDNFKRYNDKYGHKKGDLILKKVAQIIKDNIRKSDKAYRLSGGADEFIIIYSHHIEDAKYLINRIINSLDKINIKVSYGYCNICENALDIIDKKMYLNKKEKK